MKLEFQNAADTLVIAIIIIERVKYEILVELPIILENMLTSAIFPITKEVARMQTPIVDKTRFLL
jgi:hypothetical protein